MWASLRGRGWCELHLESGAGVGSTWRMGLVWAPLGEWGRCGLHLEGGVGVGSTQRAGLVWAPLGGVGLVWAPLGGRGCCGLHLEGRVGVGFTQRAGLVWAPLGGWGRCGLHLKGAVREKKEDKPLYFPNVFSRIDPQQRVILFQGMQLHRKAAEERLSGNTGGVSFLARQRQASSRRSTPNRTQQTAAVGSR